MASYEIEVIPGLEEFAEGELRSRRIGADAIIGRPREGRIAIRHLGHPGRLNQLRSALAVHELLAFDVPRPLALLGHANLTRLLAVLNGILTLYPPLTFTTVRLSAAGAGSPAFSRLQQEISTALRLESTTGPAQLQVAIRRPLAGTAGWEVAVRTSPAPLSARPWRVCNYPGALNATIANAMARLANPKPTDRFLNLACGSGTLLVERLKLVPAHVAVGVDVSASALTCAAENLQTSGHARDVTLIQGDAGELPFAAASFATVVTDLPYGQLLGSDQDVDALYHGVVRDATRVVAPGGHFIAITTRNKLFEAALEPCRPAWAVERVLTLKVPYQSGYIQPIIFALRKPGS